MKKQHQFGEAAQEAETEHAQACRSFGVNHYLLWGTGIPLEGLVRSSTSGGVLKTGESWENHHFMDWDVPFPNLMIGFTRGEEVLFLLLARKTFWLAFVPLNDQGFNGMYP